MPKKIIMLVYNYFENDSRVLKEALSLADSGYVIHIFAIWKNGLEKESIVSENVFLTRVDFTPFHKKIIGEKLFLRLKNIVYKSDKKVIKNTSAGNRHITKGIIAKPQKKTKLSFLKFFLSVINKTFSYKGFYSDVKSTIKNKKLEANYIHSHDLNTLPLGFALAKKYKAKLIYDSHELYAHRNRPYITPKWFQSLQKHIERKNIKRCDAVITVSQSIVEHLELTYKIPKPHLIMNAPFKQKKEAISDDNDLKLLLKVPLDKKLLIYSGGITFNRGLDKVIESLNLIPDAFLVFMGNGSVSYTNFLLSVATKNNVEDRFRFFGPVHSNKVTSYVQSAYLGIAPIENVCLSYYYCAPNKIFEYIQGGLPVVASKFPDMEMVITENKIGDTFDPNSPEDIAKSINNILNDNNLYNEYQNNVKSIVDKYKWENEEEKLIALYQELN
ncbi:MAG: glycosyltransferase [Flavobacteriales bacterium]